MICDRNSPPLVFWFLRGTSKQTFMDDGSGGRGGKGGAIPPVFGRIEAAARQRRCAASLLVDPDFQPCAIPDSFWSRKYFRPIRMFSCPPTKNKNNQVKSLRWSQTTLLIYVTEQQNSPKISTYGEKVKLTIIWRTRNVDFFSFLHCTCISSALTPLTQTI